MSKTYRLKEALRFYNALQEELIKLQHQGIYPKIRIITHSHGGNLSLNLAAINEARTILDNTGNTQNVIENSTQNVCFSKI